MSALPRLQRDVEKLNAGIQSLTGGYSRYFFIDYAKLFQPAVHLGREGLHVNRNFEDDFRELFSRETEVPDGESVSPKMTYAEVVRLSVPSSDTMNKPFDKKEDIDYSLYEELETGKLGSLSAKINTAVHVGPSRTHGNMQEPEASNLHRRFDDEHNYFIDSFHFNVIADFLFSH
ncbi:Hypothetical predicted protein [Mytilus galloprovincialis]|uniref:Uncharacterized protein n=1 Tax=Mytilus galloprovincialis TaxID=29158 RepID=A0A8B6E9H4_MYTGA|nr:Hypothetical predicted protein [Mytilus galloprovincialis]